MIALGLAVIWLVSHLHLVGARACRRVREIDVAHVARLARLNLTEDETKLFQEQLGRVLEYAEKLREPDTSEVETAAHAVPHFQCLARGRAAALVHGGGSTEQRAAAGQRPFHRPEGRGMTAADLAGAERRRAA